MSMENVGRFYREVATNESLRARLSEMLQPYDGQKTDEAAKESMVNQTIIPLAQQQGLPFTQEELRQYEEDLSKRKADGELSEEELEAVAGGFGIAVALCIFIGLGAGIHTGFCWITGLY